MDATPASCSWLLHTSKDLVCGLAAHGESANIKNWDEPQTVEGSLDLPVNLGLAIQAGNEFRPRFVLRDRQCPNFKPETLAFDPYGVLLLSYLCGKTMGDPISFR